MSRRPANQTAIPESTLKNQVGFGYSKVRVSSGERGVVLGMALRAFEASGSLGFLAVDNSWAALFGSMPGCPGLTGCVVCS